MSERLRDVLAAHPFNPRVSRYQPGCYCGWMTTRGNGVGHHDQHAAHVEAAVLAWLDELLGGDEAREVVGCAIAAPQLPSQHAMRYATAALAAVRALVTEASNEGDE